MSSMTRWTLAGCMALGAVLGVGSSTAEAARKQSVSSFAGKYVGADPRGTYPAWAVTISDSGQITGSFSGGRIIMRNVWSTRGTIAGNVKADGSYSCTVTVKLFDRWGTDPNGERRRAFWLTEEYQSAGKMASDASGNIVGKEKKGGTFLWLRQ